MDYSNHCPLVNHIVLWIDHCPLDTVAIVRFESLIVNLISICHIRLPASSCAKSDAKWCTLKLPRWGCTSATFIEKNDHVRSAEILHPQMSLMVVFLVVRLTNPHSNPQWTNLSDPPCAIACDFLSASGGWLFTPISRHVSRARSAQWEVWGAVQPWSPRNGWRYSIDLFLIVFMYTPIEDLIVSPDLPLGLRAAPLRSAGSDSAGAWPRAALMVGPAPSKEPLRLIPTRVGGTLPARMNSAPLMASRENLAIFPNLRRKFFHQTWAVILGNNLDHMINQFLVKSIIANNPVNKIMIHGE